MIKNPEKRAAYKKEWYQRNKDRLKELAESKKEDKKLYMEAYRKTNSEKIKEYKRQYREQNNEKIIQYAKEYEVRNRDWRNKYRNQYIQDPIIRFRANIGSLVSRAMKGRKNGESVFDYLPYTFQQLKEHLESKFESWMSWENYGGKTNDPRKTWHIDHIIPQVNFKFTSMEDEQFQECWALSNLRPLDKIENIIKGDCYIGYDRRNHP